MIVIARNSGYVKVCAIRYAFLEISILRKLLLVAQEIYQFTFSPAESDGNLEPAELYRCPDGYLFDDSILRCQKEEDVECDKVPDTVQERLERPAITLQVSELESFFRTWSF